MNVNFRKRVNGTDEGFQANWYFVIGALILGLCIPDKLNPMEMLFSKFKGDDTKQGKGNQNNNEGKS